MSYKITSRQRSAAKRLGVQIKPSTVKGKKLDIFKNGNKLASIGALGMKDFDLWKKSDGIEKAKARQKAFKSRFQKQRTKVGSPAYYADQILW